VVRKSKKAKNINHAIADELPSTVEYQGKKWLVKDRVITGEMVAKRKSAEGNPEAVFKAFDHITPKEFNNLKTTLEKEYDEAELRWAWDITTLFRETINQDGISKNVETIRVQRQYKDGSWNVVNPIDIQKQLEQEADKEVSDELGGTLWQRICRIPWWAKVIAIGALTLIIVELYRLMR